MKKKIEITVKVLELLELDPNLVSRIIPIWWYSTRQKEKGGFRLTEVGFEAFQKAGIKDYKIKFDEEVYFTNQLIIWLDHFIDCPFYINNKEIFVFSEKMAVQLVLFSGNIYKYGAAKARSIDRSAQV